MRGKSACSPVSPGFKITRFQKFYQESKTPHYVDYSGVAGLIFCLRICSISNGF
jgi:hypothetical protein